MFSFLGLVLIGIFIGGMTGVTGASGVLIMVPIFSTFFDLPLVFILGASLLVDVLASTSVSYSYFKSGNLMIREVLWMIVGALLGAQVGSLFVVSLSPILIMFLIVVGIFYFGLNMLKNGLSKNEEKNFWTVSPRLSGFAKKPFGMLLSGLIVGLSTGIFGAGGGLTIFIILYSFLKFPIKKAIGTSSFIMLLTAFSGVIGYMNQNNLDLALGLTIGISAGVGGILGSSLANKMNEKLLTKIIGYFFMFISLFIFVSKVLLPFVYKYFN